MRYRDIVVYGEGTVLTQEYDLAKELLEQEFPDHKDTNLHFYDYFFVAKIWEGDTEVVVGLVTANKYLPKRIIICDIVVHPDYRSQAIALKLLNTLSQKVKSDGYEYITGFTSTKNRKALNTYKKLGGSQEEMIVTTAKLNDTIALMTQREQGLYARENRGKR